MSISLDKLKTWIDNNDVERLIYKSPVRTISDAERISGYNKEYLIKSIVLKNKVSGEFVIAIIPGGSNVDKTNLIAGRSAKSWVLPTADEVERITGFPVGGIPPVLINEHATVFVDPRVLNKEFIVSGGGTTSSLMKMQPKLIIDMGAKKKVIAFG